MRHTKTDQFDAVVIGSGPNGLAAAITLARAGWSVRLYEAKSTVGGGMRSMELTEPGFLHDVCSAIHPLGKASPFFNELPLGKFGLEWIQPDVSMAHPFDDGTAGALFHSSIEQTGETLDVDARAYRRLMSPLVDNWEGIAAEILRPLRIPPRHPLATARFGLPAALPASWLANLVFKSERGKGFLAGLAAHSVLPMEKPPSASFGLALGILGHVVGWVIPRGGSQKIADALVAYFKTLGGEIMLDAPVQSIDELPSARAYLFDVTPRQLIRIAGNRLPEEYKKRLARYRYAPGVFKIDWALHEAIPWTATECRRAGTVHLGSTLAEIAASERAMWRGDHAERPYVLLAQQSLFDDSRAPKGKHTAWAYCHVPHGSTRDMTEHIEKQIERFAPGFKDCILARSTMNTADYERYNPNLIGGDINGGVQDFWQLFTRPTLTLKPYRTATEGIYLCSASTPPGGGVHGMCGHHAANAVLSDLG